MLVTCHYSMFGQFQLSASHSWNNQTGLLVSPCMHLLCMVHLLNYINDSHNLALSTTHLQCKVGYHTLCPQTFHHLPKLLLPLLVAPIACLESLLQYMWQRQGVGGEGIKVDTPQNIHFTTPSSYTLFTVWCGVVCVH